MNDEITSGKKS